MFRYVGKSATGGAVYKHALNDKWGIQSNTYLKPNSDLQMSDGGKSFDVKSSDKVFLVSWGTGENWTLMRTRGNRRFQISSDDAWDHFSWPGKPSTKP